MKTKNLLALIFTLALLSSHIIPFSVRAIKRDYFLTTSFDIGLEPSGWDWHLCKMGIMGKRMGFGFTLAETYKPYKNNFPKSNFLGSSVPPSSQWLNGPFESEIYELFDITNCGKIFAPSLYIRLLTWGENKNKDKEKSCCCAMASNLIDPGGGILLYVDDSFWNRIFRKPTIDYRNEKLPRPRSSNTEIGIKLIPFGGVFTFSVTAFYKRMAISKGIVMYSSSWSLGNVCSNCAGNTYYYFPGYSKNFFGFGIELIIMGGLSS